jgi:hypothetical protein
MKKSTLLFHLFLIFLISAAASGCVTPVGRTGQTTAAEAGAAPSPAPRPQAAPQPPSWFENRRMASIEYPESHYIIGVGSSKNGYIESETGAMEDIARQFSVRVHGMSATVTSRRIEGDGTHSAVFVVADTASGVKTEVDVSLDGIKIAKTVPDQAGYFYSLAVLERTAAAARLEGRVNTLRNAALQYQESGRGLEQEGKMVKASENFLEAAVLRKKLDKTVEVYQFVRNDFSPVPLSPEPLTSLQLEERAESLFSGLNIQARDGDNQKAKAGNSLPGPLAAAVIWQGQGKTVPVPDIPLLFQYRQGGGDMDREKRTGEDGIARNHVRAIKETEEKEHRIVAAFDIASMLKGFDSTHPLAAKLKNVLSSRECSFTYTVHGVIASQGDQKPQGWEKGMADLAQQLVNFLDINRELTVSSISFQELRTGKSFPFSSLVEMDLKRYFSSLKNIKVLEGGKKKKDSVSVNGFYSITPQRDVQISASIADETSTLGAGKVFIKREEIHVDDIKTMEQENPIAQNKENSYQWTAEWLLSQEHGTGLKVWTDKKEYEICDPACDQVKLFVQSDRPGYLYLFDVGTSGKIWMLFPNDRVNGSNYIPAGKAVVMPGEYWETPIWVHGPEGLERIKAVMTPEPVNWGAMDKTAGFQHIKEGNLKGLRDLSLGMEKIGGRMSESTATIFLRNRGANITRGLRAVKNK